MISIETIRHEKDTLVRSLNIRNVSFDISHIESLDASLRTVKYELEQKQHKRNDINKQIGQKDLPLQEKEVLLRVGKNLSAETKDLELKKREIEHKLREKLLDVPNIVDPQVPSGKDENDNLIVKTWEKPTTFSYAPKHHSELAEYLDIMDTPRGVKLAKSRFTLLKAAGAKLERALANFMLDVQTEENGYVEYIPPYMVNKDAMTGTGQLPKFEEDIFGLDREELFLIPTAEVPLTNIYSGEVLREDQLPLQLAAFTPCFRKEAGSYGKDTKGYLRQHQFHKVELVWITLPRESETAHRRLVAHAESILELLELPYRTVLLCGGDLGFSASKCLDIEVWLPGENTYREISSCSNCGDFQARRMDLKYKPTDGGKAQLLHTLNGSGLAIGRTLIAILENYQQENGSVVIPGVLQKYMGGLTKIEPEH